MNSLYTTAVIDEQHQARLQRQERELSASPSAGRDRIRIAALEPSDVNAVFAMLGRCSAATLYRRFHGATDGSSHATELFAGTADQAAYGAWTADRCVGLGSLAPDHDGSTHIGVLVEDSWQQRGAGSALMGALVGRIRERRLPTFVADVLADNQFLLALLARIGRTTTSLVYGGYRVRVDLEMDNMVTRSAALGPCDAGRPAQSARRVATMDALPTM